ncbi:cobyric acid synthase, partial [Comamonadaceae bacterium SL12-8]
MLSAIRSADAAPYPDPNHTRLRQRLATLHGVAPGQIDVAASASEAIQRLSAAWALATQRRGAFTAPIPGYGDYARSARAQGLPLNAAAEAGSPVLHWHTWPGSPHGHLPPHATAPKATDDIHVLDLAYWPLLLADYGADGAAANTADPLNLALLRSRGGEAANTVQLWTPNKALGLTGVRGAYLVWPQADASPLQAALRKHVQALEPSWPLGAHAVAMLEAWCWPATQVWRCGTLPVLAGWLSRLDERLADLGWQREPAHETGSPRAPFGLWAPPPALAGRLEAIGHDLRAHGLHWRETTSLGRPGHVRLRALPPPAQDVLLDRLAAFGSSSRTATARPAAPETEAPLAPCILVLGTTSHAGKSWLATALCRWYARQGLRVRPFKAQNMSNNARVVALSADDPDGGWGEIGSAQYLQALAAGVTPDVGMNPVLLKPEADCRSQVLVLGRPDAALNRMPWRERARHLAPLALQALQDLRRRCDLVIIEGAGSPAEINLADTDYVNLGTARASQAATLLVCDIDRGGAFAHVLGTHACLPADVQALLRGYVLNRFRGDAALLAPGPELVHQRCGLPLLGVLPMWYGHGLPEEDGLIDEAHPANRPIAPALGERLVGIVCPPRISNLDEFQPLRHRPGVRLRWVRHSRDLAGLNLLVLPGSKAVASDLAWLRAQGLEDGIRAHAAAGRPLLGVCGGLQMLGERLIDPHGVDGDALGLGLLPLDTVFAPDKTLARVTLRWSTCDGPWQALSGLPLTGYEIHHGQTRATSGTTPGATSGATPDNTGLTPVLAHADGTPLGWQRGPVLGLYAHGLFENPQLLDALLPRPTGASAAAPLDSVFDA